MADTLQDNIANEVYVNRGTKQTVMDLIHDGLFFVVVGNYKVLGRWIIVRKMIFHVWRFVYARSHAAIYARLTVYTIGVLALLFIKID